MPGNDSSRPDILSIANQLCGVGTAESIQPSSDLETAVTADKASPPTTNEILQRLQISLNEAIDEATEAQKSMQGWKSLLTADYVRTVSQRVVSALQIPKQDYVGLNPEVASSLYTLIQLASFIRFLESQENDAAYGNQRTQIKDALFKIKQTGRILRQLLPLTDEDIRNYVVQGISDRVLVVDKCVSALKRAIFCVVVDVILATLTSIHVVSNSVIIS
ncbi:hypothetical protein BsWGS_01864 [Bradybaena similaris]